MATRVLTLLTTLCCALGLVCTANGQTTTYSVNLTGSQSLPAVPTSASARLIASFNTDTNNITYNLEFFNIPNPFAAHIHVNAGPSENGSVAVPLWMGNFNPSPVAPPANGLVASNTIQPAAFAGPLEVLPDFNNVPVSQLLSQYIQTGRAYAQVHTLQYPDGFIRGNFESGSSQVISAAVIPLAAPVQALPLVGSGATIAVVVG